MNNPTTCNVHVQTWGTSYGAGEGFWFYLNNLLYGGNQGHAAITVTIPKNATTIEWVQKYCDDANPEYIFPKNLIPYKEKTVTLANGAKEQVFEVRFSWWPTDHESKFYLRELEYLDKIEEIPGYDLPWNEEFEALFQPESRIYKGIIGSRRMRVAPSFWHTTRKLDADELLIAEKLLEALKLENQLAALEVLREKFKIAFSKQRHTISKSEELLIRNAMQTEINVAEFAANFKKYKGVVAAKQKKIRKELQANLDLIHKAAQRLLNKGRDPYDIESYLSLGTPEHGSVYIPIKTIPGTNVGVANGMDAEAMLKQMHALVTDNVGYDFYKKSCSGTVGKILEAGVQQPHLKASAANRGLGGIASPQLVYNAAVRIQEGILADEKSTIWHRIANFQPLRLAISKLLRNLIDPDVPEITKAAAGIGLIIVLPLALLSAAITWPFRTVTNVVRNYMQKRRMARAASQEEVIQFEEDIKLGQYLNHRVHEIQGKDPLRAIEGFISDLPLDKQVIPVFSAKTRINIMKLIKQDNSVPESLINFIKQNLSVEMQNKVPLSDLLALVDSLQGLALEKCKAIAEPEIKRVIAERKGRMSFAPAKAEEPLAEQHNPASKPDDWLKP